MALGEMTCIRHIVAETSCAETSGTLLEPHGVYRTDGKRPDGVIMIPWEMGKQLV